jgi:glutamate synthase domain-containing protein 2
MQVRFFLRCLFAVSLLSLTGLPVQAEQLPLDHPCAALVKKYLTAVVQQDWKVASQMLVPSSLERRQQETINIIKTAPTMTDEENMLAGYNVRGVADLEKMTPQEFYQVDREAWHKKLKLTPEATKRKQETLKITVLGLVEEKDKGYIHATVRTSQETLTDKIEELFLISFVQDPANPKSYLISPEMKDRPVITPLDTAAPKKDKKDK